MHSVEQQVRDMRKARDLEIVETIKQSTLTYPEIAKKFGAGESTVKILARIYHCQRRVS
jgi:transposase